MNDRQEQHLKLLSQIDENIVDEATAERYRLSLRLTGRRKPNPAPMIAMAACVLLVAAIALLMWKHLFVPVADARQVPIYEGMTVSGEYAGNGETLANYTLDAPLLFAGNGGDTPSSPELPSDSAPLEEVVESTLQVEGSGEPIYYALPNQDIYITVHINNPDKFEILSFTLNGEKYSSYMFEEGSDLENLVLKVNVGDVMPCEILTYTIDAIKYVDKTEIKDVQMEGDDTVEVAIEPNFTVEEKVGTQTLSLTVTPTKRHADTSAERIEFYAVLYDGESLLDKKPFSFSKEETLTFKGLEDRTVYQYGIIATYHAADGDGTVTHVLKEQTVETLPYVEFTDVTIESKKCSFRLKWNDKNTAISLTLYENGRLVRTLSVTSTSVDGLTFASDCRLVLRYSCGKLEKTVETSFVMLRGYEPVKNGKIAAKYSPYTQIYNPTTGEYQNHTGCDIVAQGDSNVYAVAGTVVELYANAVVIRTSFGYDFIYGSLGSIAKGLKVGQTVSNNQIIGTLGNAWEGEDHLGAHLHLAVRQEYTENGEIYAKGFDPELFF